MENTDFELIKRTVSGDQDAFTTLVRKYQKRVHALAWRKTGDFHVAEEITQDTFLRAYKKLGDLKNPDLFAGWLYVIANRLCNTWFKKKAPDIQSLETVPTVELEEHVYSDWTATQHEERSAEKRVELVKRLLQKLPESERIVITLYYLSGSSCKEISEFLGVSLNTVKSRLYRARQRLQKEEHMVRETLGSFQPSTTLPENILRTLKESGAQIAPAGPSGSKPFVPWTIATSTLILVALMLGIGSQHLSRFQQPYSLDSTSEMTVDIVDASILKDFPSEPNAQNQIGSLRTPTQGKSTDQNANASLSASASGQVIDVQGNPVIGIKIALTPVKRFMDGLWLPIQPIDLSLYQAETDSQGRFSIADTAASASPIQLTLFPFDKPGVQILTVEIGGLLFYTSESFGHQGIVLTTTAGEDIKDVIVTVQHSPKISGKVNRMDGTPLANETIDLSIRELSLDDDSTIVEMPGASTTNVDGHFEKYLDSEDYIKNTATEIPTFYLVSVVYERFSAKSKPIMIRPHAETHELVFNLDISPQIPTYIHSSFTLDPINVWIINPENGHAYKKIGCANPLHAIAKAGEEDANLVTINDAAEQNWLNRVFGASVSFIGLNDIAIEGQWQWQSGEPVLYTNWAKGTLQDNKSRHEDYVILINGKWKDIGPRNSQWYDIRTAILEKNKQHIKNRSYD